jgi:hypothetical protein
MFFALNAELICHLHLKRLCSGCMTLSKAMFVRIRNSEGKYLGGEERWTPRTGPLVKIDFPGSAGDERKQTHESQTQTAQCGL